MLRKEFYSQQLQALFLLYAIMVKHIINDESFTVYLKSKNQSTTPAKKIMKESIF